MVSLTLHGGVGEVGGNKVLLRDGEHRFFLDFGTPYARLDLYYEEYLQPRAGMGLLDPLEMGLLPLFRGIYREDMEVPGMWDHFQGHPGFAELEGVEGVLVSHAHLDHCGYISFLKGEIPIYSSALTAFLIKAIQDSGRGGLEREVCYLVPRKKGSFPIETSDRHSVLAIQRPFHLGDREPGELPPEARTFWKDTPGSRKLKASGLAPASAAALDLRCFPLDHSIPGACAWAVETAAGWIVYTGDIRFHGAKAALSHSFVEQARRLQPRALVAEGTYLERTGTVSESQVLENALPAARSARGLIIADFAPRDLERLSTFLQVARESGRALVILARDAYLLEAVRLLEPGTPDLAQDPSLYLYQEPRARPDKWEEGVLRNYRHKLASPQEIRQHQDSYILCLSFPDLNELPSIHPTPGSLYIYSSSEPHDEEQKIDLRRLHNWLKHFEICPFGVPQEVKKVALGEWKVPPEEEGLHASGHASGPELLEMIKSIAPKTFIPIHTEKPYLFGEALKGTGIEVILPEEGREIPL